MRRRRCWSNTVWRWCARIDQSLTFYGIATIALRYGAAVDLHASTLAAIVTFHPTLATVVEIMVLGNFAAALAVTVSLLFQRNSSGRRSTV